MAEFLYSSYGFVDLYFVGRLGDLAAHAAVACIFPLMVLNAALFKIGQVGTLSLVAQYTGAKRDDRVADVVGTALWWSVVFSGCVALLGGVFA
ncbi:MAG: MATE family efflux transporter, partial [Planctomycetota bacterium]